MLETKNNIGYESLRWTPCRWLNFVRPLDARHLDVVRPTLKFRTAVDSACSSFWSPHTKFWRRVRRGKHLKVIAATAAINSEN